MALNWYLTLKNLSKTDARAAELYELLQKAETDDQKETAKAQAQQYIQSINNDSGQDSSGSGKTENPETENPTEETPSENHVEEDLGSDTGCDPVDNPVDTVPDNDDTDENREQEKKEELPKELNLPALNPTHKRHGLTRQEELFLQGVYLTEMTREEKILMRRSIYQKQTQAEKKIQAEYKAKRIAEKQKDLVDPEKIKYNQERKYVTAVIDARKAHRNFIWIFSQIEGLTPEILKELLKKPENRNAILQQDPKFLDNFKKGYGE